MIVFGLIYLTNHLIIHIILQKNDALIQLLCQLEEEINFLYEQAQKDPLDGSRYNWDDWEDSDWADDEGIWYELAYLSDRWGAAMRLEWIKNLILHKKEEI